MQKILYFDIDGVFINNRLEPKKALLNNQLLNRLKALGFDNFVCLSTWSTYVKHQYIPLSEKEQKEKIYRMVEASISDKEWFMPKLILEDDTEENRCKHINFEQDWYYMDNQSEYYFAKIHGKSEYIKYLNNRILDVKTNASGKDILTWLDNINQWQK